VVDWCLFLFLLRSVLISSLLLTNMPMPHTLISSTTDTTTTTSSITDAIYDSSDTKDYFNEESSSTLLPPSLPPWCICPNETNAKASKRCGRSAVWKYFQVYKEAKFKAWTFCTLCSKQVNCTDTMSTGMLLRHLRKCHRTKYDLVLKLDVENRKKIQKTSECQAKILVLLPTSQVLKGRTCIGSSKPSTSLFLQEPSILNHVPKFKHQDSLYWACETTNSTSK
jgi:hypothetical protein